MGEVLREFGIVAITIIVFGGSLYLLIQLIKWLIKPS